jgi:hypothetical protein
VFWAKKNPSTKLGLEAFFAVTHQGPAQGGKAGGGEPPMRNLTKPKWHFKPQIKKFLALPDHRGVYTPKFGTFSQSCVFAEVE